jgi:hypothetical protein
MLTSYGFAGSGSGSGSGSGAAAGELALQGCGVLALIATVVSRWRALQ